MNPLAPRGFLAIVNKAMDREPGHRYSTAGELAADVERFRDDEPILARRQTQAQSYCRARRNMVVPILAAALAALPIVVTIVSALAVARNPNGARLVSGSGGFRVRIGDALPPPAVRTLPPDAYVRPRGYVAGRADRSVAP